MQEEFLTVAEIAKILRVSETTVRNMIKDKVIRGAKVGRDYRVRKVDFDAYLREQFGDEGKER